MCGASRGGILRSLLEIRCRHFKIPPTAFFLRVALDHAGMSL